MTEEQPLPQEAASASNPEEEEAEVQLGEQITTLGTQIKEAKTAGQSKEEWDPMLKEMLRLKVCTSSTLILDDDRHEDYLFLSLSLIVNVGH